MRQAAAKTDSRRHASINYYAATKKIGFKKRNPWRIQDKADLKNEEQMAPTKVALLSLCGLLQAEALAAVSPAFVRVAASSRGVTHSLAMQATPAEDPNWYKEYAPGRLERLRGAWQAAKQWRPSQWRPSLRSLSALSRPKLSLAYLPKRLLVPLGVLLPAGALLTAAASAAGGVGSVSLLGRLLYRFEQLVYARAGFALAAFFVSLLTAGGLLWKWANPDDQLGEYPACIPFDMLASAVPSCPTPYPSKCRPPHGCATIVALRVSSSRRVCVFR